MGFNRLAELAAATPSACGGSDTRSAWLGRLRHGLLASLRALGRPARFASRLGAACSLRFAPATDLAEHDCTLMMLKWNNCVRGRQAKHAPWREALGKRDAGLLAAVDAAFTVRTSALCIDDAEKIDTQREPGKLRHLSTRLGGRPQMTQIVTTHAHLAAAPDLPTLPLQIAQQFDHVIEQLHGLCGNALRHLALAVGRVVIEEFFAGKEEGFLDRSRYKETRFADFLAYKREQLEAMGLAERTLRTYVHAWIVWRTLPPQVQEEANLASLQELSRVKDPMARVQLAVAAQREHWSVRELRAEIEAQAAASQPADKPTRRSRRAAVTTARKLQRLARTWTMTPGAAAALSKAERKALLAAVGELGKRLAAMESLLAGQG